MLLYELNNYVRGRVQYNDTLNPKLYDENNNMHPEVHAALMAVTENFLNDLDLPDMVVHDVALVGSAASYNWTKYSDVDLHIISDVDVFADPHMAEKYFQAAKNVWNNNHDVDIRGIEVEVYVEDNDQRNSGAHSPGIGRFSVMNNEWIREPIHNMPAFDEDAVNRKVKVIMQEIDRYLDGSDDISAIDHLKTKIWLMRGEGLDREGEYSVENLTFKILRNLGYLDKILKALRDAEDRDLSIKEMKINEMEEQLPSARSIVDQFEDEIRSIAARYSNQQTKDTSSPSGPNSATFRASHSGSVEVAHNVTLHYYGGMTTRMLVSLKIGGALDWKLAAKIAEEVEEAWMDIIRDYDNPQGKSVTARNGNNIVHLSFRSKDGSNYNTAGITMHSERGDQL